jgi:hypothetical protein
MRKRRSFNDAVSACPEKRFRRLRAKVIVTRPPLRAAGGAKLPAAA